MNRQLIRWSGYGAVLYILQYIYLLYTASDCTYEYDIADAVYFAICSLSHILIFFALFRFIKPLHDLDRGVFGLSLGIAITRFINELLDMFQIVHIGDVRVIAVEVAVIVLIIFYNAIKKIIYG